MVSNRFVFTFAAGDHEADGRVYGSGVQRREDVHGSDVAARRTPALSRDRSGRNARDALDRVRDGHAAFERGFDDFALHHLARAAVAALEPAALRSGGAGSGFQYSGFVHYQYELASLFRRIGDELFHADDRA